MYEPSQEELMAALLGGLLIGVACSLNYALYGRLTSMSGMFSSLIKFSGSTSFFQKLPFFVGMITVPQYFYWNYGREYKYGKHTFQLFDTDAYAIKHLSLFGWILGGMLVGFGTKMSNGCTSGHLVCGIPKRQTRSIVAGLVFLTFAAGMATYRYDHPFLSKGNIITSTIQDKMQWMSQGFAAGVTIFFIASMIRALGTADFMRHLMKYFIGMMFGAGLLVSGMCRPSKFYSFFELEYRHWDYTLLITLATAMLVNLIVFPMIDFRERRIPIDKHGQVPKEKVTAKLVVGAAIYGLGLGLTGMSPGPAMINFFTMSYAMFWVLGLAIGQTAYGFFDKNYFPVEDEAEEKARLSKAELKARAKVYKYE